MRLCMLAVLLVLLASGVARASASTPHDLCRAAAIEAARKHSVPEEVLLAITLVETRHRRDGVVGPWPWTVNVAGRGAWFDSRAEALAHAEAALARGETSFDVGCFQLNFRWHGEAFSSIDDMFDPRGAGDYAARFLRSLYEESGDWMVAAGHYHSRTPKHSRRYRNAVMEAMNGADPVELPATDILTALDAPAAESPEPPMATVVTSPILRKSTGPLLTLGAPRPVSPSLQSAGSVGLAFTGTGRPLLGATR